MTRPSILKTEHYKLPELGVYYYGNALEKRRQKSETSWFPSGRACGGYGRRCGQTEAATEQPIAAPAWPSYGTRPPLRNLCVLRTVRAAGSGFRGRHRALCAGRGILGRLFGLSDAARPRNWRYVIAHRMRDKVTPASPRCCCTVTCTRPRAGRLHCATSRLATLNKRDFIARTRCAESASWCSCAPCACYIRT